MNFYELRIKRKLEQEREQEKKLLRILEKHKNESYDKVVRYKISFGNDSDCNLYDNIFWKAQRLLEEAKFFNITYQFRNSDGIICVIGTPKFARELCEFFVDYKGISKENIGEAEELTKEKIEEIIDFRSKLFVAKFGWYETEVFRDSPDLINKKPPVKILESYDGEISLDVNIKKAFVDLDYDTVVNGIRFYLDRMVDLQYIIVEEESRINLNIRSKHSQCLELWKIFIEGFGRHNMNNSCLVIK